MRRRFDVPLMDVQMVWMGGCRATVMIRQHETLAGYHTPIIGLSAGVLDGDRGAAIAAGLDDYLTKPLRKDGLRAMLDRWKGPGPMSDSVTAGAIAIVQSQATVDAMTPAPTVNASEALGV